MLFGGGGISAAVETITFSEQGFDNGEAVLTVTGTGITITFDKGTNSNAPKYYTSGTAIRAYGGNYFTVTANGKKITEIGIGFGSDDGSNSITTNSGTYSSGTWTGNAESVTFTIGGTKGNRRIASIAVTYVSEQGQGTLDPQNSFANATENATVGVPCTVQEITTLSTGRKSYASSDETVATIDGSGNVTLKKAGETTITVTTAADDNYKEGSASYKLIVAKGTPVLSFAQETVTAYLGTDQNGPELNNPSKIAVTYEISNPDIATIQSNGYIQPKATGTAIVTVTPADTDAWNSVQASYTLVVKEPFHIDAEGDYEWVKDASKLAVGDELVIVYQSSNTAVATVMGNQDTNNFKYVAVNYADGITDKSVITIPQAKAAQATPILLEGSEGAWYFHTNNGYLCAVPSDNNYLKTTTTIDDYAKATISITDTEATIKFLGKNTRNIIRYNSQSSLFSCYSSGQNPVQLYRKVPSNVAPTITFSPASGTVVDYGTQVTITARTATSITYSVNNGEPVTVNGTSATVTINTHTTIKATATNDYGTSEEVTAEYTINQESSALSYNPTEYTITIGDDFTAPEVNKPADYNGTITYSSDNTDVAEVDATTGEVTIKAVGVANITASGTETEHYAAATASYKITVNKKTYAVSFAEAVVEITYGDNYNKQAATTEGVNGNLIYTSSNETVVKFHGNNVIDVLGPGTVTITATAPATDTTEESSATYTLKIYEPADAVEGATLALDEHFDDCIADVPNENKWWGSNDFKALPDGNGWSVSNPTNAAGNGCLKVGTSNGGTATSPSFTLDGTTSFSFDVAPWLAPTEGHAIEAGTITVTLDNATFNDGSNSISLNIVDDLTAWQFTNKQYEIKGTGESVTIQFSSGARFFLDNVVVGGGAQPAHEIKLTFGPLGYLTWVATADIDFSQTEGVTAYQITEATPKKITMVEVDKVPEGAAVMLKGSGTKTLKRTTEEVADLSDNKMRACTNTSVTGITGSATSTDIYVLGNGNKGLGFYMLSGTLQAGKGYLNISVGAGAKPSFITFEETTGISNAAVETTEDDGTYYNLQGVRVMNPQKGIYIKNGKKIVIK
ncbi:MAG: Ig-like domain-containing protein [Prevotella sp.]|nr:Ig-like domain-containing protein [Prevotella sp.]